MKTLLISIVMILRCSQFVAAQTVPADSLYLGQLPPGDTPQIFHLAAGPGAFDAERIAISNDGKEIFYSVLHQYYPTSGDTIKVYRYADDRWTGPFALIDGYSSPALSCSGDTLFFQNNNAVYESFYSVRNGMNWSPPRRILPGLNTVHYLQQTLNGHLYASSIPVQGTGGADWCSLDVSAGDTTAVSLGMPVSSGADNLDFFISRHESYLILAKNGLKISYRKEDGGWTNPKSLGSKINFGLGMWGPFVSADDKYLFYTTGIKPDYSDTHVFWVRADRLIDSLRYTNFIPWVKNQVPLQNAGVGRDYSFIVPDSTFVDDDGNNTLHYSARLTNTSPLPSWLTFDTITAAFSGRPESVQTLNIRVTATDQAGASAFVTFKLVIEDTLSAGTMKEHGLRIYPNPVRDRLHVSLEEPTGKPVVAEISNMRGDIIRRAGFDHECCFDLSGVPKGIYLLKTVIHDKPGYKRFCVD